MIKIIIASVSVIAVLGVAYIIYRGSKRRKIKVNPALKPINTDCENFYYQKIKECLPSKYYIQAQVKLGSIIKDDLVQYKKYLNCIFDFVIFRASDNMPMLAVEVNDRTHERADRKQRDKAIYAICKQAELKLVTFWTKSKHWNNTEQFIKKQILSNLPA